MKENQKKAFDFAADTTKQLINVSTAIITVTITFSKEFNNAAKNSIFLSWICFILSIIFGLGTLMSLTGTLQPIKKKNLIITSFDSCDDEKSDLDKININNLNIRILASTQIFLFILAIVFIVIYGIKTLMYSSKVQTNSLNITISD